jgi:hypothetical protein
MPMKLRQEHLWILDALRHMGGGISVGMVRKSLGLRHSMSERDLNFYTVQRVFAMLDQLQTMELVSAAMVVQFAQNGGATVWGLTKKGLRCLTENHH